MAPVGRHCLTLHVQNWSVSVQLKLKSLTAVKQEKKWRLNSVRIVCLVKHFGDIW